MTVYVPFLIANMRVGLERDLQPWLLPNDAFPDLENAYQYRGIIFKKGGFESIGRLGTRTDYLAVRGAPPQVYAGNTIYAPIEPGSLVITDGITIFTDNGLGVMAVTAGAGIAGTINYVTGAYVVTFTGVNAGAAVTATYLVVVGNNSPVMGLRTRDIPPTTEESLVAFDVTSAYEYNVVSLSFDHTRFYKSTSNVVAWTGTNSDFFFTTNYQNALFATNNTAGAAYYTITNVTVAAAAQITTSAANNFVVGDKVYINNITNAGVSMNARSGQVTVPGNPFTTDINTAACGAYASGGVVWSLTHTNTGDGIRWFDGYTAGLNPATGWVNFAPPLDSTDTPNILRGCLLMFPYKDRLVCLNTLESKNTVAGATRFPQRARYSQIGTVYYNAETAPVVTSSLLPATFTGAAQADAWYEIPGKGGFIDCPTAEELISAEFIKDTLVVYFERSTYRLSYTGNPTLPFVWEKVNTEIGAESTFSLVPFDKEILSVGANGIYDCDSINIDRIDQLIPDEVFGFHNGNQGIKRVYGIRDYYNQFAYWSYVDSATDGVFPNRILSYNYQDSSWSIFTNSFTCFGYYQRVRDLLWGTAVHPWATYNVAWRSGSFQSGFPFIVAGNQQGFVFDISLVDAEQKVNINDKSLVIQNVTAANPSVITSPNHNLLEGDFVLITDVGGSTGINNQIFEVGPAPTVTQNTFTLIDSTGTPLQTGGVYTFGGKITVIDNFDIMTKKFNPFLNLGKKTRIGYVDLFMQDTDVGEFTLEVYADENDVTPVVTREVNTDANPGQGNPNPPVDNQKNWHRVYINISAQTIALKMRFSTDFNTGQIYSLLNNEEDFALHGMMLWMSPPGRFI